jgi:hypothetical protein
LVLVLVLVLSKIPGIYLLLCYAHPGCSTIRMLLDSGSSLPWLASGDKRLTIQLFVLPDSVWPGRQSHHRSSPGIGAFAGNPVDR